MSQSQNNSSDDPDSESEIRRVFGATATLFKFIAVGLTGLHVVAFIGGSFVFGSLRVTVIVLSFILLFSVPLTIFAWLAYGLQLFYSKVGPKHIPIKRV